MRPQEKSAHESSEREEIETANISFTDGVLIELITMPEGLKLLRWSNGDIIIGERIEHADKLYCAARLSPTILRAIRLPGPPADYGTTADLFERIVLAVDGCVQASPRDVQLIAAWAFSTWLSDQLEAAPSLLVYSPLSAEVSSLLRVLRALCRRGLQLADLHPTGFLSLPMEIQPTLLMNLAGLPRHLASLVRASNIKGAFVMRSRELTELHCPKVLFSFGNHVPASVGEGMIRVSVAPAGRARHLVDEQTARKIADEFQPLMLEYRLRNCNLVAKADVDVPTFAHGTREVARALGAAIVGDPELQVRVVNLLYPQDEDARAENQLLPDFAIVQSLLALIHRRTSSSVTVKDLTSLVNAALRAKGEFRGFCPSEIGYKLRALGFFTKRSAAGKQLTFDRDLSRQVHALARAYGIPLRKEGFPNCPDCKDPDMTENAKLLQGVQGVHPADT